MELDRAPPSAGRKAGAATSRVRRPGGNRRDDRVERRDRLQERFPAVQVDLVPDAMLAPAEAEVVAEAIAEDKGAAAAGPALAAERERARRRLSDHPIAHEPVARAGNRLAEAPLDRHGAGPGLEMGKARWRVARRLVVVGDAPRGAQPVLPTL